MKLMLAVLLLAICAIAHASAQESEDSKRCDEAWLAGTWPVVIVRCEATASQKDDIAIEHKTHSESGEPTYEGESADVVAMGAQLRKDELELASTTWALASIAIARAAVAENQIKRTGSARAHLAEAVTYAKQSLDVAQTEDGMKFAQNLISVLTPALFRMKPSAIRPLQYNV